MSESLELSLDARFVRRLVLAVFGVTLLLWLADATLNHAHWIDDRAIRRIFNMTREDGMASWFGVSVSTLTAVTAWLVLGILRARGASRWRLAGWAVLALFLSWMAVDDGAVIHERIGGAFDPPSEATGGLGGFAGRFPSYDWLYVVLPVLGGIGLAALAFLWIDSRSRAARSLVAAAPLCFAVAVGLDFLEGLEPDHRWNLYMNAATRFESLESLAGRLYGEPAYETLRHFAKTTEEGIEIAGMTFLWGAVLLRLSDLAGEIRLRGTP